jgi:hypothetical protein
MTTLRDAIEAIRKNGYPKAHGQYIEYSFNGDGRVIRACAAGQGALNLPDMAPSTFESIINVFIRAVGGISINESNFTTLHNLNDWTILSIPQIADVLEEQLKNYLDEAFTVMVY